MNMDSFSSSVKSVEGYLHAVVLVDNQTGYRWIYGIKTKDETIKVVKQWYSYIADLHARHKLVVVMSDNACETYGKGGRCNQSRICSQHKCLCSLHSGKKDSNDFEPS